MREAGLAHLARFASSEAGVARVLERRIARWARQALDLGADPDRIRSEQEQARAVVPAVVGELVGIGAVSDAGFAETRARALLRGGRSRRAIAAHLAGRGIDAEAAAQAVQKVGHGALDDDAQAELAAALLAARKRRIGPFAADPDPAALGEEQAGRRRAPGARALGALARAGFAHDVAQRALEYDREAAETLISRLRGG